MSYFASSTTTRAKKGRINAVNRLAIREQWLLLEFEGLIADLLAQNPWHSILHEAWQEVNKKNEVPGELCEEEQGLRLLSDYFAKS